MHAKFTVEADTAFYGRTAREYGELFDLHRSDLDDADVLDCPGGPSSFTAVASAIAASTVAVDPRYGADVEVLAAECERTIDRFETQLRERRDDFVWTHYGDVETRVGYARAAAERFLADYDRHPERYVAAALPTLPFDVDAFDLVCSANFCFLYDDRFDRTFHVRSLQELARVAREEVRVFPLADLADERSRYVDPVVDTLREDGLTAEIRPVPYEFQPDVTEMLVVSDVEGYGPP